MRSRLEAIQKLKPPMTVKGCRSFGGMVIFLSLFCSELQKLLKAIHNLSRKGKKFIFSWDKKEIIKTTSTTLTRQ